MKLLLVHNEYGRFSGEETIFHGIVGLLRASGHDVRTFVRSSAAIPSGLRGNARAFVEGMWSESSRREFDNVCARFQPDLVQVQNLYPLISPSILQVVKSRRIPLVMMCQNYRLFCPTGLMLRDGAVCTRCATGGEWHCVRHNCEGSLARSLGYAIRNRIARPRLLAQAGQFIVLSAFQADRFVEWGVARDRISVVPNFIDPAHFPCSPTEAGQGRYVAFAGRLSPEKGVSFLLEVARRMPGVRFEIAGHAERMPAGLVVPPNVCFRGELSREALRDFYRKASLVVVPSVWYETFGFVALEAMLQERAVVASRIGGLADIVVNGVTGRLVPPGDVEAWVATVAELWAEPGRANALGRQGRERAVTEYAPDRFLERLMTVYRSAGAVEASPLRVRSSGRVREASEV